MMMVLFHLHVVNDDDVDTLILQLHVVNDDVIDDEKNF
jgi:hypothetical protein